METKIKARKRMMDMIALRDHSEKELRTKLREKFRDQEDSDEAIDAAIDYAKEHQWLGDPAKLADRMAEMLHRRRKGIEYINNYLSEKGLPTVSTDYDLELEKALHLVKNKFLEQGEELKGEATEAESAKKFEQADKARIARFLAARGFDSETVRKVVYEKL